MPNQNPELSIIMVSYNTDEITQQALTAIAQDYKNNETLTDKIEVIIVDNNSKDNSVASLKKIKNNFPCPFTLISNTDNSGFAKANNQGLAQAKGKYFLLLNSDTIVQPGALAQLLETARATDSQQKKQATFPQKSVGLLTAQLLNPDLSLQPQGGSLPTLFSLATHYLMLDDFPVLNRFLPSTQHTGINTRENVGDVLLQTKGWIAGTALLIKRQLYEEIGGLDENIFMYGEDMEYCLRAFHHHWFCLLDPQAKIIHLGSASSTKFNAVIGEIKGYYYIWAKHYPSWQSPVLKLIIRLGIVLRLVVFATIAYNNAKLKIYQQVWSHL